MQDRRTHDRRQFGKKIVIRSVPPTREEEGTALGWLFVLVGLISLSLGGLSIYAGERIDSQLLFTVGILMCVVGFGSMMVSALCFTDAEGL